MKKAGVFLVLAALLAVSGCDISGILPIGPTPPPTVRTVQADPTGDTSGPAVAFDVVRLESRRFANQGASRYTDLILFVEFANPLSDLRLPSPGSHPTSDGSELAWALCIDTVPSSGYPINPSAPQVGCDYLVDGGALTAGQGGVGRQPDGRYRVVKVVSSSPLSLSDTGARAEALVMLDMSVLQVTADIRPLDITTPSAAVAAVFAAGNRSGGVWNVSDFAPDGAMGMRH